jgi:hypothetical protein
LRPLLRFPRGADTSSEYLQRSGLFQPLTGCKICGLFRHGL